MKKLIPLILMLTYTVFFVSCSKTVKPYRVGLINSVIGEAQVIGVNGAATPARPGIPLDKGMKIKTIGKKSICEVYFNDNAIKVFGDSEVKVEWLTYNMKTNADETALLVDKGRVFAKVTRKFMKDDAFIVKTNTTVAAVRGTEFFVSSSGASSNVSCLDGKVEVHNKALKNAPVAISEKEESTSIKGKKPTKSPIQPKREKILKSDSNVQPVTQKNKEIFEKLDRGDSATVKSIRESVKRMSGSEPEKAEKHDTDIFFFKG
jgi:hypothetical protein